MATHRLKTFRAGPVSPLAAPQEQAPSSDDGCVIIALVYDKLQRRLVREQSVKNGTRHDRDWYLMIAEQGGPPAPLWGDAP